MTKILVDSELLDRAIEALQYESLQGFRDGVAGELRAALSAPQQEAVATLIEPPLDSMRDQFWVSQEDAERLAKLPGGTKLYTHPAPSVLEQEARKQLGELLAVIHGDGGQYAAEHGIAKATADAIAKWAALRTAPKAPTTDDRKDELAADSKRALELLGSIYYCGHFVAETRNEQELEALMRKHGYFIETESQFDAHCQRVAKADAAMAAQKGEKERHNA